MPVTALAASRPQHDGGVAAILAGQQAAPRGLAEIHEVDPVGLAASPGASGKEVG